MLNHFFSLVDKFIVLQVSPPFRSLGIKWKVSEGLPHAWPTEATAKLMQFFQYLTHDVSVVEPLSKKQNTFLGWEKFVSGGSGKDTASLKLFILNMKHVVRSKAMRTTSIACSDTPIELHCKLPDVVLIAHLFGYLSRPRLA